MGDLDELYSTYCGVASELLVAPPGNRRSQLQERADEAWLSYVDQKGGREPWHKVGQPWEYQDGFVEMRPRSTEGAIRELRRLLNIPQSLGPYYEEKYEGVAVRTFQRNHHLPVTGVCDRSTWQVLIAERGQGKPVTLPTSYQLPGSSGAPISIVLRAKHRWTIALDHTPQRTFANQHNLAVLAEYAYEDEDDLETQFVTNWNQDRLREDSTVAIDGVSSRFVLREAAPGFNYRLKFISKVVEESKTSTQLFLLDCPQHTVVAFRGTDPASVDRAWNDVRTDLTATEYPWAASQGQGFLVHKGFGSAFDSIREPLQDALNEYTSSNPHKPIYVTGHSLGGALATLCACYLRSHPVLSGHPVQLYTFAQPRVGVKAFAEHYWLRSPAWVSDPMFTYYRMANIFDTVTMVPSKYLADEVADGFDLLLDATRGIRAAMPFVLVGLADWQVKEWARQRLAELCPPHLDYRHFGRLVLCGVDTSNQPFLHEIGKGLPRTIEHESNPKLQSIYHANPYWHPMGHYRGFLMRAFEQHALEYVRRQEVDLPMVVGPALAPMELQLFHRYLHASGLPAYHSIEDYRGEHK